MKHFKDRLKQHPEPSAALAVQCSDTGETLGVLLINPLLTLNTRLERLIGDHFGCEVISVVGLCDPAIRTGAIEITLWRADGERSVRGAGFVVTTVY